MRSALVLLSLLFYIPVFSQEWMEDKEDLNGQVKSVYYTFITGNGVDDGFGFTSIKRSDYNPNGFLTRFSSSESADGEESYSFYRVFDKEQKYCLIQYGLFNGDTSRKQVIEYSNQGRVKSEKNYDNAGLLSTIKYTYNDAGLVSQCFSDYTKTSYKYDESGRKIMESEVSEGFKQVKTWSYSIDGKLTEEKSELIKAPPTTIIKMNNDGTIAEEKVLDRNPDDDRNYVITYSYNANGQKDKEVKRYLDGRFQYAKSTIYLANGNIEQEECFTEDGKQVGQLFKYEYDSRGNWTKITEYWDGKVENTRERVIVYY